MFTISYLNNVSFLLNLLFCLQMCSGQEVYDNECYTVMRSLLDQYKRSFTLLDIGANQGYYSLRIAQDYQAVCVMAEEKGSLLEICKASNLPNIMLLNTIFSPEKLRHLGECEHFDVILALNIPSMYGEEWRAALDAMMGLGDYLIVKVSSRDTELEQYVQKHNGQVLGKVCGNSGLVTLYSISLSNGYLHRKTWLRSVMHTENRYCIKSSFIDKQLVKPVAWPHGALKNTPWIPGINLCTFKMCHGIYPTVEQLKEELLKLKDISHTDWLVNNMIIQGTTLALIDNDDPLCKRYFSETLLQAHEELLSLTDPAKVEHYFWNKLIKVSTSRRQIIKFFSQLFPVSSLIFDIGSSDNILIDRYLGYGAKIVCCNARTEDAGWLNETSKLEDLYMDKRSIDNDFFDNLIAKYGKPRFCIIHDSVEHVWSYVKRLSQTIDCVAYKFDIRDKESLYMCLKHLVRLGYTRFNFSVRELPTFILDNNPYISIKRDWAYSIDELVQNIDEFAQLDYEGDALWGYIYARVL